MATVSRPLLSCLLALASLLTACGDTQPLKCTEVDCGPGTCEQVGELAVCSCPVEYVTTGLSCRSTDPGATREEATFLEPGSGQAVLSDKDDVDVFSFHVEAGRIYIFSCAVNFPSYYFMCPARLTSESGEVLPTRGADGDLGYEATTTGTVYAVVRHEPFVDLPPVLCPISTH